MGRTVVIITYRAVPAQVDVARREISNLIATVQSTEPDCGGITMLQSTTDPKSFTLIEHWPSQETYLGPHMEQPHIQAFIQAAGAFLAGPPDITFWHPVSDCPDPTP